MSARRQVVAFLVAAALLPAPALAGFGAASSGPWADVHGGLGAGDRPFKASPSWSAGAGVWFGKTDTDFALGRHTSLGLRVRQDLQLVTDRRWARTAPMFEVRRGLDLLVVGVRFGLLGGPLLRTPLDGGPTRLTGGTVRAEGGLTYRFHRFWGLGLRLEAGIDIEDRRVAPALGLTLGIELARPWQAHRQAPAPPVIDDGWLSEPAPE